MNSHSSQKRKRQDGEATRERIIAAAIELLSKEGLGSVSTGKLAKRVGIVQSGFYAHFGSLEECTLDAAERIGQRLRDLIVRKMPEEDTIDPDSLAQFVQEMLARFEKEWTFVDLMIRYRRDPSLLGKIMSRFHDRVREDVVDNLIEVGPEGTEAAERYLFVPAAHLIVTQFVATLEIIAEERTPDRKALAGQLAAQIQLAAKYAYESVDQRRSARAPGNVPD